ncbi:MAG: hypothetical protein ABIZ05_03055 [Pseudonocardiaceae bacterium]
MVVVGGLVAVVVVAAVGMLALGSRGMVIVSVVGPLVGIIGLFVTITGQRASSVSNDRLRESAQELARKVRDQEANALARLMADSGDPKPADVSFTQPAPPYSRVDGGDPRGTLREVEKYYRSLGRGRMVVLGAPGAGKTVLAIQLVLDLTAAVLGAADGTRSLPRVPVRVSLPAFDPGADSDMVRPTVLSTRLDDWLIQHLVTVFGLTATVAAALVTGGWILPVLDGLDEMDHDGTAPRRAASVIRAVNQPSAGGVRPVVITCRTSRYQQLRGRGESAGAAATQPQITANAGRRDVVQDATVVDVEPLLGSSVVDYLTYRFPDPADQTQVEARWHPIIERLTADDSGSDFLAAALGSPLRLFLTATAYRDDTSTPAELTALATAAELDDHLFTQLVPAVLEEHPPEGRQYAAPKVTEWLTTLAGHLAWQGEHGGSRSDLRLDLLWPAAGWCAPRYAAMAATTTAASVLFTFGVLPRWPPDVRSVLGLGTLVAVSAWVALRPTVDLRRLDLSGLRTFAGRRRTGLLLAVGLAAGLVGGLTIAPVSTAVGLMGRLVVTLQCGALGIVGSFVIGLGSGPTSRPAAIDRPARLVQQGMAHTITAIVATCLTFLLTDKLISGGLAAGGVGALVAGLATWLAIGVANGREIGPVIGLAAGLAVGLRNNLPFAVVALVVGLIFAANSPWPRYLFATLLLARRGDLPRRPAAFIDWAYEAGLLRLSGIAVQFRHREFQTWLATRGHGGRQGAP